MGEKTSVKTNSVKRKVVLADPSRIMWKTGGLYVDLETSRRFVHSVVHGTRIVCFGQRLTNLFGNLVS